MVENILSPCLGFKSNDAQFEPGSYAYFPQKFAKGAEPPERDGCLTHIDVAQHIEHEPERYAAHGCYHRLYGMRRRTDRILEVAEMDARLRVYLRLVMALLSRLLRGEKRAEDGILYGKMRTVYTS
jgi:hypothetical protein